MRDLKDLLPKCGILEVARRRLDTSPSPGAGRFAKLVTFKPDWSNEVTLCQAIEQLMFRAAGMTVLVADHSAQVSKGL